MSRSEFDFDVIGGPATRPPARPAPAPGPAQPTTAGKPAAGDGK
jgi:hypothetical protein